MKNWDLRKWPPIGRGLLTGSRSERSPGRGEGRGRELGCNSHNHPSRNDLPPPLIVVHDAHGETTPTGPPSRRAGPGAAGLCRWLCLRRAPEFGDGPRFPTPPEPNELLPPHHLDALRTNHNWIPRRSPSLHSSLPRSNTHRRRAGTRGGHPFQAHALVSSPNKLKL